MRKVWKLPNLTHYNLLPVINNCLPLNIILTGQVGLGVGSWPSNRATEGSNPEGTRLYFVILLKECRKNI